jgi:hypothetical protein
MQIRARLAALILAAAFAGCADAARVTGPQQQPAGPSFNGTGWFGSGNRSDSTAAPTNSTTITSSTLEAPGDSALAAANGTGWFGSGN